MRMRLAAPSVPTPALTRSALWASLQELLQRTLPWWKWLLVPVALFYLAVVARYFGILMTNTEWSADASSAQVIGELFAHKGGATVHLGDVAWYSTLIFELATHWLPDHRLIWGAGPYGFALISIVLVGWSASRLAGRFAAVLTMVTLVCASPVMLGQMLWLNNHMTTCYSLALLGALVVLLETGAERMRRSLFLFLVAASAIVVGVNMASDQLLVIAAPASLMLATVATWRMYPGEPSARAAGWSALALVVMCAAALATVSIMHSAQVYGAPFRLTFASSEAISTNFRDWWESISLLGNGSFFGDALTLTSALAAVCGVLTVTVVLVMPRFTWQTLATRSVQSRPAGGPTAAYLIFWTSCTVLLSSAFIFSSSPAGLETSRYLDSLIYACAAVVPLYAARNPIIRYCVILGTFLFALTSTKGLLNSTLIAEPPTNVSPAIARKVTEVAERLHATQGEAVYWDAAPLTWFSHMRVRAYPFFGCLHNNMCPPSVNWMSNWYDRPAATRTFLVSDSTLPYPPQPEFGPAIATYHFGTVTMYVFEGDIGRFVR